MTAGRPMPTQDDVLGYFNTLSNWGRWGDDDELGTLNHITDDVRLAAARAVRHGRSVSCAWEVAVPQDMERSTTTCPCAADMPGAEDMPVPDSATTGAGAFRPSGSASRSTATPSPTSTRRARSLGRHDVQRAVALVGRRRNGIGVGGRHGGGERDHHAWCPAGHCEGPRCGWLEPGQGVFPDDSGGRASPGCAGAIWRCGSPADRLWPVRHEAGEASGFTQAGWHASCPPGLHNGRSRSSALTPPRTFNRQGTKTC